MVALLRNKPLAVGAKSVPLAFVFCTKPLAFADTAVTAPMRALHAPALKLGFLLAAPILDEFALTAEFVVFDALLAPYLSLPALELFRPRGDQVIHLERRGDAGLGVDAVDDDMDVRVRLVVMPDQQGCRPAC